MLFPTVDFAVFFLNAADLFMRLTVLLAAPVIIALFVSDFGLGLVNRFSPQLNVFFLSMPIKSAVAMFVLLLYVPVLFYFLQQKYIELDTLFVFLSNVLK